MSLNDILWKAEILGFTQEERHEVGDVYRRAFCYAQRNPLASCIYWAEHIAEQYITEQLDKWQRHDYKVKEGKHRRSEG